MRRGEMCALSWSDVDLDAGVIRVRWQLTQEGREVAFAEPKSQRSKRDVSIDEHTVDVLKRHQIRQGIDKAQWEQDYRDSGLVFTHANGEPIRPDYLTKALPKLAKRAEVRAVRFHDLRHGSATYGLAAGEEMLEVSRRLGHTSYQLTADTYSHTVPQRVREAASKRAALVFGEAGSA